MPKCKTATLTLLAAGFLAATFTNAASAGDPRKCTPPGNVRTYGITPAQTCAKAAAERAIWTHIGAEPNVTCTARTANWLIWRCVYGQTTRKTVTVTFRALANGWHTRLAAG